MASSPNGSVAMINVTGPLRKYGNWNGAGHMEYVDALNGIYGDNKFCGAVLIIDSPGGQAQGCRAFYNTVANPIKPIGTFINGTCASAAVYLSAGSDVIMASDSTDEIGSIGMVATIIDMKKFMAEKVGMTIHEIYADQSIDKNGDFRLLFDKGDDSLIRADLTRTNAQFIADVSAKRPIKSKDKEPFTGKMYDAKTAQEFGLIDGIGTLDDVVMEVIDRSKTSKKTSTNINMGEHKKGLFSWLTSGEKTEEKKAVEQSMEALIGERDEALAQVTTLTAERDDFKKSFEAAKAAKVELEMKMQTATSAFEAQTAKVIELTEKVAEYGDQPGEKPTKVHKKHDTEMNVQDLDESAFDHNRRADELAGKTK
jgi:protease-4